MPGSCLPPAPRRPWVGGVSCCLLAPPSIPRETSAPLRQLLLALLQRNHKDRMDFGERLPGPRQACSASALDGPPVWGAASWLLAPHPQLLGAHSRFPAAQAVNTPVLQWEVLPPGKPVRWGLGGGSARRGEEPPAGAGSLHAWRDAGWDGCQSLLKLRPQWRGWVGVGTLVPQGTLGSGLS